MPLIMGIVNVTPDSFFEASRRCSMQEAIDYGLQLEEEGADWLDIGGQSTRPGSARLSEEEELARVLPVVEGLNKKCRLPLSIDTFYPKVAKAALQSGACLINDITALQDPEMERLALDTQAQLCLMHMQGSFETMHQKFSYPQGVLQEVKGFLKLRVAQLERLGLDKSRLIIDPGIGFGKSVQENVTLINHLKEFQDLGCRILLGVSRKSFMSKILNVPPSELLSTTIAVNTMAILAGVDFLRVHDVRPHRLVVDLLASMKEC